MVICRQTWFSCLFWGFSTIQSNASEKPEAGYSVAGEGCNVELTEVETGGTCESCKSIDVRRWHRERTAQQRAARLARVQKSGGAVEDAMKVQLSPELQSPDDRAQKLNSNVALVGTTGAIALEILAMSRGEMTVMVGGSEVATARTQNLPRLCATCSTFSAMALWPQPPLPS
jgi:1-aminocyclopropane-1-carboxylate deaminase/D-cysteine desulfhydrase-like pyridoxal-dependent ACC family enzyme